MYVSCSESVPLVKELDASAIIRKSNIIYDSASFQSGIPLVPPYLSNGIIGGCFDHTGFQHLPKTGTPQGRTVLGYAGHYYMHPQTTRQAMLPLAYITAGFKDGSSLLNMMETSGYKQELDIYSGVLTTEYDLFGKTKITSFAHQTIPGLLVMKIDRRASDPDKYLVLQINCQTAATQSSWPWKPDSSLIDMKLVEGRVEITSTTNMVETKWKVTANADFKIDGSTLQVELSEEETVLKIWVPRDDYPENQVTDQSYSELYQSHINSWHSNWERSWVSLPEERGNHIWNRGNYYNLSNFPVVPTKALIPTGMNANVWGFTFPQDVYYVAENLLRSGHFERYKLSMQYWLDILPEVLRYSKRIMEVEGGFYPWTPPFDQWDEFEKNGVVGNDSYEIHNPVYVAAMVWHYYQRTNDLEFLEKYFPIIKEVWRFYSNVSHANDKGTFDVNHHHAAGQDEANKLPSSKNLLCASYSAEYAARLYHNAIQLFPDQDSELKARVQKILDKGYERGELLNDYGYYATYEGDNRPPNSQKHPVQLNAVTFVPMADRAQETPLLKAFENRYYLTTQAQKPVSHGWTYAAFALASSRLGQGESFARDMTAPQFCAQADPRWIQFYEYTFWERWTVHLAYYFVTHGLYQQAYTDALVQDWRGYVEVFAALMPDWKEDSIDFKGITTINGITIDGHRNDGHLRLVIHPNGASTISLKVSSFEGDLNISGDAETLGKIPAGRLVTIELDPEKEVVIYR